MNSVIFPVSSIVAVASATIPCGPSGPRPGLPTASPSKILTIGGLNALNPLVSAPGIILIEPNSLSGSSILLNAGTVG